MGGIAAIVGIIFVVFIIIMAKRSGSSAKSISDASTNISDSDSQPKGSNSPNISEFIESQLEKQVSSKIQHPIPPILPPLIQSEKQPQQNGSVVEIETERYSNLSKETFDEAIPPIDAQPVRLGILTKCENCDRTIGKLETSCKFKGHVVCIQCHQQLNKQM